MFDIIKRHREAPKAGTHLDAENAQQAIADYFKYPNQPADYSNGSWQLAYMHEHNGEMVPTLVIEIPRTTTAAPVATAIAA